MGDVARAKQIKKRPRFTSRKEKYVKFTGSSSFRNRILCATLSGKAIRIDDIRIHDENPGLRDYEASLLRLVEKVTNGCIIQINNTGTAMKYTPGVIVGGEDLEHKCPLTRSIGYYIEFLLGLCPFGKSPTKMTLTGITNEDNDTSVDILRVVTVPTVYKKFGIDADTTIVKCNKRGAAPLGGGEVYLSIPIVPSLKPIMALDTGKVKRIRGVAFTARCSPMFGTRIIEAARGVLNGFIPDVYVHADHYKGKDAGLSSGYGVMLLAETINGVVFSVELTAQPDILPEDLGKMVAYLLLEEISKKGCCDSSHQSLMLLFMALCSEDVSKLRIGKLTQQTVTTLREIREFFGVTFKITPDSDTDTIIMTCVGSGFKNISRKAI